MAQELSMRDAYPMGLSALPSLSNIFVSNVGFVADNSNLGQKR